VDQVITVHDPAYVNAVRSGAPQDLAESQGFAWDAGLWPMVLASNGGAVAAALTALKDGVAGSLSSGLHHARRNRGAGFCTFNGLVIAAREALAAGARSVLILDLDAHCGGGTASLIADEPGIRQIDVSVDRFDAYSPNPRVKLEIVERAKDYLPTIASLLTESLGENSGDESGVDLCIYNAGMDPFEGSAIGGLSGITRGVLAVRESMVFEACRVRDIPIAFVLAGGYTGGEFSEDALVDLHRLTLEAATIS
jgi:acetoin utilization deacetylase AcuC-like enzyme